MTPSSTTSAGRSATRAATAHRHPAFQCRRNRVQADEAAAAMYRGCSPLWTGLVMAPAVHSTARHEGQLLHVSCPTGAFAGKSKVCASLTILRADTTPTRAPCILQCRHCLATPPAYCFVRAAACVLRGRQSCPVGYGISGRQACRPMNAEISNHGQDKISHAHATTTIFMHVKHEARETVYISKDFHD